jgi:hypothetical protein
MSRATLPLGNIKNKSINNLTVNFLYTNRHKSKVNKKKFFTTRQTSTLRINRNYLSVLIQEIDVLLISSQSKISR